MSNESEYLKEIAQNTLEIATDENAVDLTATNNLIAQVRDGLPLDVPTSSSVVLLAQIAQSLLDTTTLLAKLTDTQPVSVATLPLPTNAATDSTLIEVRDRIPPTGIASSANQAEELIRLGALAEPAAVSDSANVGVIPLFKRLLTKIQTTSGGVRVNVIDGGGATANQQDAIMSCIGLRNEQVAATNSPSGLNGLLRLISQKLPSLGRSAMNSSFSVAIASDHPGINIAPDCFSSSVSTTAGTNSFLLVPTDVGKYRSCCLHIYSAVPSGTVIVFEGSNDTANWTAIRIESFATDPSSTINGITSPGQYYCLLKFRYFRIRVSAGFGGIVMGSIYLSSSYLPLESTTVKFNSKADPTQSRWTTSLNTASSPFLYTNSNRKALILANPDSNRTIYVGIGSSPAVSTVNYSFIIPPLSEKTFTGELASSHFMAVVANGSSSINITEIFN